MTQLETRILDSIDETNENQWNNVVTQSERGTLFHRVEWLRSIEEGIEFEPKHVVVEKGTNPIAICPNFVTPIDVPVDVPQSLDKLLLRELTSISPGYGGPVILSEEERAFNRILDTINNVERGGIVSHRMRILDTDHVRYSQHLEKAGYKASLLNCRFWIPLNDYETILEGMDKERRKEIRTAKGRDFEISDRDVNKQTLREFYALYRKTMDRVDGICYPFRFFQSISNNLDSLFRIFSVEVDGRTIGEHLYLLDQNRDSVHYFFAATDEEYFNYSPSTLLHDYAIRWAIDKDYGRYDFGSTNSNYRNGVFRYKSKFGAQISPVYSWENTQYSLWGPIYKYGRFLYRRHSSALNN